MRAAFEDINPFIELHTARVCPDCKRVCCIDRHGTYEQEDLLFIRALGEAPSPIVPKDIDTEPCRQLCMTGCSIERWRRPWRCTWYFCDALLLEMPGDDPKGYRVFIERLRELQNCRAAIHAACNPASIT